MCTLCSRHVLLKQQFSAFCKCVPWCVCVSLCVRACTLASEVDAGSLSQCYQDHGEAWMLQEAHADVARRGNGLSLPTINNHIQNTSTPHTFLFTRRLFHGLFYYKWPHLELPAAAVMEEARAVDPAGVTSRKKSPWVRHFFCVWIAAESNVWASHFESGVGGLRWGIFTAAKARQRSSNALDWMILTGHFIRLLPNGFKRSSIMFLHPTSFTLSHTLTELLGALYFFSAIPHNLDGTKGPTVFRSIP